MHETQDRQERRRSLSDAWRKAADDLRIRVEAPFQFLAGAARYDCVAYLSDFGSENGMVLEGIFPPDFIRNDQFTGAATAAGYFVSHISADVCASYDARTFREALADWGYFGPDGTRPDWLGDT